MLLFYLSMIDNEDDRNWLSKVYKDYKPWMLKTAYNYIKHTEDSKDVVHEIFLRMSRNIKSVPRNPITLKVYLETAIRNICYTITTRRNKHPIFSIEEQFYMMSDEDLEENTINKILSEQVLDYIEQMPVIYCSVLTLYLVCKNKVSDISNILDIPYKTVESRLYRGKQLLNERFEDLNLW